MSRRNRVLLSAAALVGIAVTSASAQLIVTDQATTARNAATARLKSSILEVLTEQHSKLRRMARRLSAHTNLDKYASPEPPWFLASGRRGRSLLSTIRRQPREMRRRHA